jgi:hypothetical protein
MLELTAATTNAAVSIDTPRSLTFTMNAAKFYHVATRVDVPRPPSHMLCNYLNSLDLHALCGQSSCFFDALLESVWRPRAWLTGLPAV